MCSQNTQLAKAWNIELAKLPHHAQPTHINDLMNFMEDGSVEMFWISGTNPYVELPAHRRCIKAGMALTYST